ncbi:hypothetical protein OOK60_13715 [Trichothermofontia sichuanensis B231]|uniref:ribonuclease toxin HepT-like protein n=1 Tax=Trichothermofontia sichuanensis TaxID=3045816 RepID=UPI0022483A8D|nr:hypothetical protein [Trichothermofontia sichuanensis]UZQ53548.1 hypothetical protein OOK60_13715 [Trichothermofontia sichuanensis B231]
MTEYLTLSAVIRQKLAELSQIVDRINAIRQRIETTEEDEFYLDAIALNLHGFYTCLEQIFEAIARTIGEGMPTGSHWHQALLLQMSVAVPTVRPAVISQASRQRLDTYRGFRHVVRNVYTFNLEAARVLALAMDLTLCYDQVVADLDQFCQFLDRMGQEPEE